MDLARIHAVKMKVAVTIQDQINTSVLTLQIQILVVVVVLNSFVTQMKYVILIAKTVFYLLVPIFVVQSAIQLELLLKAQSSRLSLMLILSTSKLV